MVGQGKSKLQPREGESMFSERVWTPLFGSVWSAWWQFIDHHWHLPCRSCQAAALKSAVKHHPWTQHLQKPAAGSPHHPLSLISFGLVSGHLPTFFVPGTLHADTFTLPHPLELYQETSVIYGWYWMWLGLNICASWRFKTLASTSGLLCSPFLPSKGTGTCGLLLDPITPKNSVTFRD